MKKQVIIPVRLGDSYLSFSAGDCCKDITAVSLKLWRPACVVTTRQCVGRNACGALVYKVTTPVLPSITLYPQGALDSCGRAKFLLPQGFFDLGTGRVDGQLDYTGGSMKIMLQIFTKSPEISCHTDGCVA